MNKRESRRQLRKDAVEIGRAYLRDNPDASLEEVGDHVKQEIKNRHSQGKYGIISVVMLTAALLSIYVNVKKLCEEDPQEDWMDDFSDN